MRYIKLLHRYRQQFTQICGIFQTKKPPFRAVFYSQDHAAVHSPSHTFGNPAAKGGSTAAVAADFLMSARLLLRRLDSDEEKISYKQA